MLELSKMSSAYGRLKVLWDVSLKVKEGEIVTIIGANGAGKTTLLKNIIGLHKPMSGKVFFKGQDITGWRTDKVVRIGLGMVPEGRLIFCSLSVMDNLLLGTYGQIERAKKDVINKQLEQIFNIFPVLKERIKQKAGTLSGGEQQMLAISRALMTNPRLLIMDEPSLGLAPLVVHEIWQIILKLNQSGIPILLVEQNALAALRISKRGYVLENGRVVLEGEAQELLSNEDIKYHYLGAKASETVGA